MTDYRAARVSDDEFMSLCEFSRLSSDARHAVWRAHAEKRIESRPATPGSVMRVYRRDQVEALQRRPSGQPEPGQVSG